MKRPAVILCVAGGVVVLAFFALRTHDEDDKQVQADAPGLAQPPSLGLSKDLPDIDQGSITTGAPSRRPRSLRGSGAGATTTPPSQEAIRTESNTHDVSGTSAGEAPPLPTVIASTLQNECRKVAEDLAGEESRPREDLLAMYGRSSAASGRFDLAAAAYAMFLEEFGTRHPYAERVAMRLADCLAPLDLDSIEIVHLPGGPEFHPRWRRRTWPGPTSRQPRPGGCGGWWPSTQTTPRSLRPRIGLNVWMRKFVEGLAGWPIRWLPCKPRSRSEPKQGPRTKSTSRSSIGYEGAAIVPASWLSVVGPAPGPIGRSPLDCPATTT